MKSTNRDWKAFTPEKGNDYPGDSGQVYRCRRVLGDCTATMTNKRNGWTFTAQGCELCSDGAISWKRVSNERFLEPIRD